MKALKRRQLASEVLPSATSTACTTGPPVELLTPQALRRQLNRMINPRSLIAMALDMAHAEKVQLGSTIHRSARLVAALRFQATPEVSDSLNVVEGNSDHRRYIIKKTA
jgi:hypothetical protein